MMGHEPPPQDNLFSYGVSLDQRIRPGHPLRKIEEVLDLEFVSGRVQDCYGMNGNVSVPPPTIVKLMLLLVFYNVRSERELIATVPERLDWLWFLGFTLDTSVPDHSVLSKARRRWGVEVFRELFERVVLQCVEAGLVDGDKLFIDSSLVDADASNNSVVDTYSLKRHLNKSYRELERRLEGSEGEENSDPEGGSGGGVNRRYVSTTDPDASIVRRGGSRLRYQVHRGVDPRAEVITATEVTAGAVNEAHRMVPLMDAHRDNTGTRAEAVVADSKYGTIENLLGCTDRGVRPHMPALRQNASRRAARRDIFPETEFIYDSRTDTYRCPAGKQLKPRRLHAARQSREYAALKKDCDGCGLRSSCTRNRQGRTIKRHLRQEELDKMLEVTRTSSARSDIRKRQHLMERSFARATRFGHGRSRWRRLWRVQIQEYLTATLQNIETLLRHRRRPSGTAMALAMSLVNGSIAPHQLVDALLPSPDNC